MNNRCALVSKIIAFSCVDGRQPHGIIRHRAAICAAELPLNPWMGRCNDCGECVSRCPHHALSVDGGKSGMAVGHLRAVRYLPENVPTAGNANGADHER